MEHKLSKFLAIGVAASSLLLASCDGVSVFSAPTATATKDTCPQTETIHRSESGEIHGVAIANVDGKHLGVNDERGSRWVNLDRYKPTSYREIILYTADGENVQATYLCTDPLTNKAAATQTPENH